MADFFTETYPDSRTLVVAFTGYGGDAAPPQHFEWWAVLHRFHVNRIFLKDTQQHWYLSGIKDFGDTAPAVAERIRHYADVHKIERIVTIGSSMGGFGALHIGGMIEADQALTFGGNFSSRAEFMLSYGDQRCREKLVELAATGRGCDLSEAVPPFTNYFDPEFTFDAAHARRLAQLKNGETKAVNGTGHHVAEALIRSRQISKILSDALQYSSNNEGLTHDRSPDGERTLKR